MRRLPLSTLLLAINVGLLLLAVTGVAFVAVALLRQLADEQALARVTQAGLVARQAVTRSEDEALTAAQLLAERPTLRRLLQEDDVPALAAFLAQFQQTSRLAGTAVLVDGQVIAQGGATLPWAELWAAHAADDGRFLRNQPGQGGPALDAPLVLGAWAPVPDQPGAAVIVARLLDASFSRQLGDEVGLPVSVWARENVLGSAQDAGQAVRRQVLEAGTPQAVRMDARGLYLADVPLTAPSGEVVGVMEAELPTSGSARSLEQLIGTLFLLALGVAALAALASLAVGRRLSQPLQALTRAAAGIGRGDLTTPTPVPTAPGAEIGLLAATLEDMRRRLLQLTADLRRQEAEAQAIVTGIVEGVFSVDRERRIRYLNPQAAALLGLRAEDALGRFCGDVLRPQGVGGVRPCEEHCPILHARFRGATRATEYLEPLSGRRRTVVITSAPPAEDVQVQVLRDETEIEATRRMRDAVLANISHEFRTPLSAQLASIELLQDQLPELETEQIGQLVASLQRGTLRLTQLVDNLLESARIEARRDSVRRRPVALDGVVEEALALTQPLLRQREQNIDVALPYPLPTILGDAPRLTQVFVNLLANAQKFAPAGSTIRIGGSVDAMTVTVWVEDEGPGLPALAGAGHRAPGAGLEAGPDEPALFTRFMRAPDGEPEQSGAGLGLWIVKSIVERHGGRVQAYNTGHGTRMAVVLPQNGEQAAGSGEQGA